MQTHASEPLAAVNKSNIVVLAGGGLGLLAGGVLGGLALAKQAEAQEIADARAAGASSSLEEIARYNEALESRHDLRLTSGVIAGTAAVFSAVGLVLYLFDAPVAPPIADPEPLNKTSAPPSKPTIELSHNGLAVRF